MSEDVCFDRVHRLSLKPDSPVIAKCTFYKDKEKILKDRYKLKGSSIFIGEDFSLRVREIRKQLLPHLKSAKVQGKKATMVYDHLIIDGKSFILASDGSLQEQSRR